MARAALYDAFGGPEVLYVAEVPETAPGEGQVAVRVSAAALNPFNAKARQGLMVFGEPSFPSGTGTDLAGTVTDVGEGAAYFDGVPVQVGDEVLGSAAGAVAERVVTAAAKLARRPAEVPAEVAAGLFTAGLTALSSIRAVPVGPGDTVLLGGAAGGVGIVYAQLAIAAGARVVGTASPRNFEFLRGLGVEPIEYGSGLAERVAPLGPFSAVLDAHGRDAVDAGIALGVAPSRIVAIANHHQVADLGVVFPSRERTSADLAALAAETAAGRLLLPVAATFPLDEVADAFRALEAPHAPGKIVVLP